MQQWNIESEEKTKPEDLRFLIGRLHDFNVTNSPTPFERKDVRLFIRDEAGEILGGFLGTVSLHCLIIQILWVEEPLRGGGMGRSLVERAMEIAMAHGAKQAIVETTSFQAPGFYEKLGFAIICEIPDCPIGAKTLLLLRSL